jgi:hypothetical protein
MNAAGVLRSRGRMLRNLFLARGAGTRRAQAWTSLGLAAIASAILFWIFGVLFEPLASSPEGIARAGALLGIVLGAVLVALVVFDVHYAVSALFTDSDLDLLRRAPVRPAELFGIKLIDSLPQTTMVLLVVALPVTVAFARILPVPGWALVLLPLQLAALWTIPLGIGSALALLLLRRVPAARAREALGLISSLTLTLLWLANAFLLPRMQDPERITEALGAAHAWASFSPAHWLASALVSAHLGEARPAIAATLRLLAAGAIAGGLAVWLASLQLEATLARVATARPRPRSGARRRRRASGGAIRALILRDARLFGRDWTVLSDVLTASLLWTLLPLVSAPVVTDLPATTLARLMLLGLAVALGYEIAARSVPFERDGFAWVRMAPLPAWRWVAAKAAGAGVLSLPLIGLALASVLALMPGAATGWPLTVALTLSALALALAVGIWNGITFADWKWTNPRAMLTATGRMVAIGLLLAQLGLWAATAHWLEADPNRNALLGVALPAVLALLLAIGPLRWAARRMVRLES